MIVSQTPAISAVVFTPVTAGRHTLEIRVDGEPVNADKLCFVAVADAAAAEATRQGKPSARRLAKMELKGVDSAAEAFSRSLLATARKIITSGVAEVAAASLSAPGAVSAVAAVAAAGKQPLLSPLAAAGAAVAQPKKIVPAGKRQIIVGEHDTEVRCFPEMDALVVGHLVPKAIIELSGEQTVMDQGIWVKLSAECTAEVAEPDFKHFDAWVLQSASDGYGGGVFYSEMDGTSCQSWTEFTEAVAAEEAARVAKQEELRLAEAAKEAAKAVAATAKAIQDLDKNSDQAPGDDDEDIEVGGTVAEPEEPKLRAHYSFRQARAIRAAFAAALWHGNVTQVNLWHCLVVLKVAFAFELLCLRCCFFCFFGFFFCFFFCFFRMPCCWQHSSSSRLV